MALTPAELWIHPSDNRLLQTNPVTSVLNQHYSQCLSNWVMFKHTKRGNRWLLQYVDTECLSCATASICVYTRGFFFVCTVNDTKSQSGIISVGTFKHGTGTNMAL